MTYSEWESLVAQSLSETLKIPFNDAMGVVEAQDFYIMQSWAKGLDSSEAASVIISKVFQKTC